MLSRVTVFIIAMAFAGSVAAHSQKESTIPSDGAILSQAPKMIEMNFDKPMRVTFIRMINGAGSILPLERQTGLEPSLEFTARPTKLEPGTYSIEWRGLAVDGHPMQGRFSFELTGK